MNRNVNISLIIAVVAGILYIPFIGGLHLFDWDEINFAESAREMILTKDYLTVQIFFEPFWEKPPLFIWLQVLSMKIFGVNEFAARFPNALCGIVTLVFLFNLGKKLVNEKFGVIWSTAYGISILPFFYFKSGIIDPWFNLFIFIGITYYFFSQNEAKQKLKYAKIALSAFFIGLAVLTKGPVAILVFGLTAFILLITDKFKLKLKTGHVLVFVIVLILSGGFWFILQVLSGNWQTVVDFFVYQVRLFREQDAGHGGFPFYHFVILLFGVFPASAFAIQAHRRNNAFHLYANEYRKAMLTLLWVVLILFSIVQTKIVHYSSLCYFPLTFLAAYSVYGFLSKKKRIPAWLATIQIFTIVLFSAAVMVLPIFEKYKGLLIEKGFITDPFVAGNLQAETNWGVFVSLIGLILLAGGTFATIQLRKNKLPQGFKLLAICSAVFFYLSIIFVTPGAEKISQNAHIEFFKSLKNNDVYAHNLFKSYAMLFYTNAMPPENPEAFNLHWLIFGDIDKDAWFVARANKKESIRETYKNLEYVNEKNGYVFYVRRKPNITINDKQ